jgi:putative CocE/NonD family hydrolase
MGEGRPPSEPSYTDREGRLAQLGQWREASDWPLPDTRYTPFYIHADGTLSPVPPEPSEPSRYIFDPRDPVPTLGGGISAANQVMPPGAYDQQAGPRFYGSRDTLPLAARNDVLAFQTEPLKGAVQVTGPITIKLWASSSALDTDFTAKLIDVHPHSTDYPGGFAANLSDSIVRARYRNDREHAELLEPGQVYAFEIVLYPTSNVFGAGHRIRLDVSSSNFPRFDVNPNTGGPLGRERRFVLAENAIYHDPEHPSHVVLPVIVQPA